MRKLLLAALCPAFFASVACSSESDPPGQPVDSGVADSTPADTTGDTPVVQPTFKSTVDKTVAAKKPRLTEDEALKLGGGPAKDPAVRDKLVADGYGELVDMPGEPHQPRVQPGLTAPEKNPARKFLTRFVHMPDFQLLDDEGPARLAGLDGPTSFLAAADRPHVAEMCILVNQAVHTVNLVNAQAKIDFALLGGDNIDTAQDNELDWALSILDGQAGVKCDSGDADDPVTGPANDGKDAFDAEGLKVPWYWTTGNHDVEGSGNEPIDFENDGVVDKGVLERFTGTSADNGTRDYRKPGGPVFVGAVIADPKRKPLSRKALMSKLAGKTGGPGPLGHGVGAAQVASGKANYTADIGDKIRLVVWDSAAETGGERGLLRKGDMDSFLKPALDKAQADDRYVFVVSHHAIDAIGDGGGTFGTVQPDAVKGEVFKELLASYPNVIASVVGHSHRNRVEWIPGGSRGFWEIMTSAIADWPQQIRVLEVFDELNGFVTMKVTAVDLDLTGASEAVKRGRTLCTVDWTSGWGSGGTGEQDDRNVELLIKVK